MLSYLFARSARRRTVAVTVNEKAQVTVYAPRSVDEKVIDDFLRVKSSWIIEKVEQARRRRTMARRRSFKDGAPVLFLGKKYTLSVGQSQQRNSRITCEDGCLHALLAPHHTVTQAVTRWYRLQAQEVFAGRVFHYTRIMGLSLNRITVRGQKRIWGSCRRTNRSINFNWRLVMAPLPVIDYVIVHELAHLKVPNHSQRFWRAVRAVLPDYRSRQQWLRDHAAALSFP